MSENKEKNQVDKKKRTLILDAEVGVASIRKIVEAILDINEYDRDKESSVEGYVAKPIKLITNTFGGSVYEANFLISIMETSLTPVHTYTYGKTMSAGFYIFSAGHKRFASPLATFMYHDGSVGLHDSIEGLKENLEWQERVRDQMDDYIEAHTNIPREMMDYKKERKQDWYMTAKEAHSFGLVDEIIPFRNQK